MTSILLVRLAALASLATTSMASSSFSPPPPPRGARHHHQQQQQQQQTAAAAFSATVSSAKTFHLVLNVTVPGTDFAGNASINKVVLGTEHVGAGHTALVPSATGPGGAVDLAYTVNHTIQDGLSPNYWESFYMGSSATTSDDDDDKEDEGADQVLYAVELIIGSEAEFGVTIIDDDDDGEKGKTECLAVSSSVKNGTFAICNQGFDAPEAPQYSLYFVEQPQGNSTADNSSTDTDTDGSAAAVAVESYVPANCVAVTLLPQCATSDDFDDSEQVQEVFCYEDVAGIDWSLQAACS